MKLPFIKYSKYNFSFDFFQKQHVYPFYDKLFNHTNHNEVINEDFQSEDSLGNVIHEIKFIPSYFELKTPFLTPKYKFIKYKRVNNFRINLDGFSNAEDYLKGQMRSKSRSQIRSKIRRLETCFNIRYVFYYGNITKNTYNFLFNQLEFLIKKRFIQRGGQFSLINKWDAIKADAYQLILEKKASLFVIYDDNKPIDICLNYHFQNIMQHLIRSYDIDYSKYELGHIDIFKQIEWCISNNCRIFDFMWGELEYKTRWCNEISLFEHHFIFKNNNPIKLIFVKIMIKLYKINDHVKQKKNYKRLIKAKSLFTKKEALVKKDLVITFENINSMPSVDELTAIDINNKLYEFIRKPVYDFQYSHFETTTNINVFKMNNYINSYIIEGTKSQIKVTLIKNQ